MPIAAIGLGANLGDKKGQIEKACQNLAGLPETRLIEVSRLFRTRPVGKTDQDWFVNAAALIETDLTPRRLLEQLLKIEQLLGRVRTGKWGPRLIDLDLLFYDQVVVEEEDLLVPHPYLDKRLFVLIPLAELAPDWIHPVLGLSVLEMAERIDDPYQEVVA